MEFNFWKKYFVYTTPAITLTAGSGSTYVTENLVINRDADFEISRTMQNSTYSSAKIKIKDGLAGRYLDRNPVDMLSWFGASIADTISSGAFSNQFYPYLWPRPYLVSANSTLTIEAADYSTVGDTLRLAFHGAKIMPGMAPWNRKYRAAEPTVYNFPSPASVAANGTTTQVIQIDVNSDFIVEGITSIQNGAFLVMFTAEGDSWSNAVVHNTLLCGNALFPNRFPGDAKRFLRAGSAVTALITDFSGATNTIDITLHGKQLYR